MPSIFPRSQACPSQYAKYLTTSLHRYQAGKGMEQWEWYQPSERCQEDQWDSLSSLFLTSVEVPRHESKERASYSYPFTNWHRETDPAGNAIGCLRSWIPEVSRKIHGNKNQADEESNGIHFELAEAGHRSPFPCLAKTQRQARQWGVLIEKAWLGCDLTRARGYPVAAELAARGIHQMSKIPAVGFLWLSLFVSSDNIRVSGQLLI